MGDVAESVWALSGTQRKLFMLLLIEHAGALLPTRYAGHRYRSSTRWSSDGGRRSVAGWRRATTSWLMDTGHPCAHGAEKLMVDAEPFHLYVAEIVTYLRDAYRNANAAAASTRSSVSRSRWLPPTPAHPARQLWRVHGPMR